MVIRKMVPLEEPFVLPGGIDARPPAVPSKANSRSFPAFLSLSKRVSR